METKYEIAFGNIFMETFEETHLYPLIKEKLELLLRYIHYTFFIWTSSESNFLQFISKTNEMHPSIKFDVNCLNTQINFLGTPKKKKKKKKKSPSGKYLTNYIEEKSTDNPISMENWSI